MAKAMDIQIYTGPVTDESLDSEDEIFQKQTETLESTINTLRAQADFAILECLTDIKFPDPKSFEISIQAWPKGRIFCPDFELRWERIEGNWLSVVAIANGHPLNKKIIGFGFKLHELSGCLPTNEKKYFLWDSENPRLGRRLKYECLPDAGSGANQPPLLKIIEYRDACGYLIFWRYLNMEYEHESL
ncbi:MAG: hypothetical protein ACE5I1_29890 [bacterium]